MYAKAKPSLSWTCRPGTRTACGMASIRSILYMTSALVWQSHDLKLHQDEVSGIFRTLKLLCQNFYHLGCEMLAVIRYLGPPSW